MRNGRLHRARRGFSLLEIILTLAILCGAIPIITELARLAVYNARHARDLPIAQLLCESKMAEIASGSLPPDPVSQSPIEGMVDAAGQPTWSYSIEAESMDLEGLLGVRVTITQEVQPGLEPIEFSMTRWMVDPEAAFAEPVEEEEDEEDAESDEESDDPSDDTSGDPSDDPSSDSPGDAPGDPTDRPPGGRTDDPSDRPSDPEPAGSAERLDAAGSTDSTEHTDSSKHSVASEFPGSTKLPHSTERRRQPWIALASTGTHCPDADGAGR